MQAIIGIGSNIRPSENIRKSIELLSKYLRVEQVSSVYRSPAEDRPDQPWFYNCAVKVDTDLSAERLKRDVLARIEADLGRVRSGDKFAARTIDLDLLAYRETEGGASECASVAPDILRHPWVAIPLAELDPGLSLGDNGMSIGEAVREMPPDVLEKLSEYSGALLREFEAGRETR